MAKTRKRRPGPASLSARRSGLVAGNEAHQVGRHNAGRDLYILNESLKSIGNTTLASLHQLPPDIADFVGRTHELTDLTNLFSEDSRKDSSTPAVVSISGKPGVGKSALATHIAHQVARQFPDGQLYVDLRGANQERLEPVEVLGQLLRALGIPNEVIPDQLAERGAQYRSQLSNARMLLFFDNAFDESQVRPLIPASSSCAVIITARVPLLTLPGTHSITLDLPDLAEAVSLLRAIAGRERIDAEPTEAERVVRRCGYLPLAIRVVGARLRSRPQWSVAHLADRLDRAAERQRLDEFEGGDLGVRASLALSYQGLSSLDQRAFRYASLLNFADYSSGVVAALTASTPRLASESLERLLDAQLLEPSTTPNRYRYHDLNRIFATERLRADDSAGQRRSAIVRALRWYTNMAHAADTHLTPSRHSAHQSDKRFGSVAEVVAWLDAERANLIIAFTTAYEMGEWDIVGRLADQLFSFLEARSDSEDWERANDLALRAAKNAGDPLAEAVALDNVGQIHMSRGRVNEAIACYEESLSLAISTGSPLMEVELRDALARAHYAARNWNEALRRSEAMPSLFRKYKREAFELSSMVNLADLYLAVGQAEKALELLQKALARNRELGARRREADCLISFARVHLVRGRFEAAVEFYNQGQEIYGELGDLPDRRDAMIEFGRWLRYVGRASDAITYLDQGFSLSEEFEDNRKYGSNLRELGRAHQLLGHLHEAASYYERAKSYIGQRNSAIANAVAGIDLGTLMAEEGRLEECRTYLNSSLALFRETQQDLRIAKSLNYLAPVYDAQGEPEKAIAACDEAISILERLGDTYWHGRSLLTLGRTLRKQNDEAAEIRIKQGLQLIATVIGAKPNGKPLTDQDRLVSQWSP